MISPTPYKSSNDEKEFLEILKNKYTKLGFNFVIQPSPHQLPKFLGSYRPDAIAEKTGENIAIEVKRYQIRSAEPALKQISRLFDGHPDWRLIVSYMAPDPLASLVIPASAPTQVVKRLEEVRLLTMQREYRASFIMAWSLLEAILQYVKRDDEAHPRQPGTVVQTLVMLGYIDPETEKRLLPLITLRNRIVHGDLMAEPTPEDVQAVLLATEEALSNDNANR